MFYHRCWKERNEIYHSNKNQFEVIKNWVEKLKEKVDEKESNAKRFIEAYPLREVNKENLLYAKKWIETVQKFIKNYKSHESDDIRKYLGRGVKRKE